MTRDDLEAAIWRAMRPSRTVSALRVVDDILRAADEYAAGEAALGALRRKQLEEALKEAA